MREVEFWDAASLTATISAKGRNSGSIQAGMGAVNDPGELWTLAPPLKMGRGKTEEGPIADVGC